jgi:hypothetical protein
MASEKTYYRIFQGTNANFPSSRCKLMPYRTATRQVRFELGALCDLGVKAPKIVDKVGYKALLRPNWRVRREL